MIQLWADLLDDLAEGKVIEPASDMRHSSVRASKRARRPAKGTKDQRRIWRFELKGQSAPIRRSVSCYAVTGAPE